MNFLLQNINMVLLKSSSTLILFYGEYKEIHEF
jgi:hypothetical protein